MYAERGYHVIVQSTRGTYGSGGVMEPMSTEQEDGLDTVEWLRQQQWFTGTFATFGPSYLGYTQWALLADPPKELVAAIIVVGPHDIHDIVHGDGAFNLELALGWSQSTSTQEERSLWQGLLNQVLPSRLKPVHDAMAAVPLSKAKGLLAGKAPWYDKWATIRDKQDPYWAKRMQHAALKRTQVPVLLFAGWQDPFLMQNLDQYEQLTNNGTNVALTVGPWTHAGASAGLRVISNEAFDWLSEHLAGTGPVSRPKVKVNIVGTKEWRGLDSWPPVTTMQHLYPAGHNRLTSSAPTETSEVGFTYDPANPTPSVGGARLSPLAGRKDNKALEARDDVLVFTSDALPADLTVMGRPVIALDHASDNPYCDVFVRICEVDTKGVSTNVVDGFVRLDGGGAVRLELRATAHLFRAGSRIRLTISGGAHPHYERNNGTGKDPWDDGELVPSRRTIALGPDTRLDLPVAAGAKH
jgi:putative CocE/NonD family hydrolase